jgi:hypothetical protein
VLDQVGQLCANLLVGRCRAIRVDHDLERHSTTDPA